MKPSDCNENALFELSPPPRTIGAIETKVREVIDGLEADGLIRGKYIAIAATLISTAAAVDEGMRGGPKGVSVATAQLTKLLTEGLESLPEPVQGQDPFYDALDAQIAALTKESLT